MYHSPGLRDGVFLRAWSPPPYLPAIHDPEIASVRRWRLGNKFGRVGVLLIRRSRLMRPSQRDRGEVAWTDCGLLRFGNDEYPFVALSV
jgi:hypothetical protein